MNMANAKQLKNIGKHLSEEDVAAMNQEQKDNLESLKKFATKPMPPPQQKIVNIQGN